MSEKQKLMLIGCGDLPSRLIQKIDLNNWQVRGLRRSTLLLEGVEMSFGDASDARVVEPLLAEQPEQIILCLTPDSRDTSSYRHTYLRATHTLSHLAKKLSPFSHLIFVSSTSVYGQNCGEEITENSETKPSRDQSQVLLEAEQKIVTGTNPWSVVRFSGIYGHDRTRLIKNIRAEKFTSNSSASWTNRIHSDDCAGVLKQILQTFSETNQGVGYLIGSDCEPALNTEVENWLSEKLEVSPPEQIARIKNSKVSGKRCKNSKLLDLGFRFQYPSFREGYRALIDTAS